LAIQASIKAVLNALYLPPGVIETKEANTLILENLRISIDRSGSYIATSNNDKNVRIREASSGTCLIKIKLKELATSIVFSKGNRDLYITHSDGGISTVRLPEDLFVEEPEEEKLIVIDELDGDSQTQTLFRDHLKHKELEVLDQKRLENQQSQTSDDDDEEENFKDFDESPKNSRRIEEMETKLKEIPIAISLNFDSSMILKQKRLYIDDLDNNVDGFVDILEENVLLETDTSRKNTENSPHPGERYSSNVKNQELKQPKLDEMFEQVVDEIPSDLVKSVTKFEGATLVAETKLDIFDEEEKDEMFISINYMGEMNKFGKKDKTEAPPDDDSNQNMCMSLSSIYIIKKSQKFPEVLKPNSQDPFDLKRDVDLKVIKENSQEDYNSNKSWFCFYIIFFPII
jgi:hypothetical protein